MKQMASKSLPTKAFLSQTRPIYSMSREDDGELAVEPGEICFDSVLPGTLYVLTFSVRNTTKVAQRIRILPPKSGFFALNYIPAGPVAPGLDIRAEVECQIPHDSKEILFTDKIVALMGPHKVEIPIVAYKPYANIKFKRRVDCGNVVLGQLQMPEVIFENIADIPGSVKLTYSNDSFIKHITPVKFELEAKGASKCKHTVKIHVDGKQLGNFRELIKVSVVGTLEDMFIDISANFIEQKLLLLTEGNNGLLETADFGHLFYGETKTVDALLVNPGPFPLSFAAMYEGEEEGTAASDAPQTEDLSAFYAKSLTIYPIDGMVKAFSQISVKFSFKPQLHEPAKGFHRQHVDDNRAERSLGRRVTIECAEAEQRISVSLQGSTTSPSVTVNPHVLRFGECPVNDRRDILLTIANKTKHETPFEFPSLANFKFDPARGVLKSLESKSVIASFLPPQLGVFKTLVKVSLAHGLNHVEIRCLGDANERGDRKRLVGGTDKMPLDFTVSRKFVNPEEELTGRVDKRKEREQEEREKEIKMSVSGKTKIPGTGYIALKQDGPSMIFDEAGNTQAKMNAPADAFDNVSSASSREREVLYGLADHSIAKPLEPDHPHLTRVSHNKMYDNFLQESYTRRIQQRTLQSKKRTLLRGAVDFENPNGVNMGMERGLDEPTLKLPDAGEPLWLMSGGKDGDGAGGASRMPTDENRLINKKYSSSPATQAELRDCNAELSQDDLKLVFASHKTLDFGRVSVGSLSAKNFAVSNDLKQSVMVKVEELEVELQQSKYLCQIIPQGAVAGFDIYFQSRQVGKFRKVFQWKINGIHSSKVVVTAEVVPIEVEMSHEELLMEFPPDSLQPTLTSEIVLTNPGNAAADFLWGSAGAFQCNPDAGTIPPAKSTVISVTWSPLTGKRSEEELGLHITGGVDRALRVKGKQFETKAEFLEKRIVLGVMAVGTEKVVNAPLKNVGSHPLVFFLNMLDEKLGIRMSPLEALVMPGETLNVTLYITPRAAMNYDNTTITARIRGGKQVSFKLAGSSIIPQLTLFEEAFHFGSVTISSEYRLPLTILNRTGILTTMLLDLDNYPDFYPYVRGAADEEDEILASVVGGVNPEQHDTSGNQVQLINDRLLVTATTNTLSNGASAVAAAPAAATALRRGKRSNRSNVWKIMVLPNATISIELIFRPSSARQFAFKLPLFLQGIPDDKTYQRDVTASAVTSVLGVSEFVVDFGDRVVSRDPMSRMSYFLETTIKNVATRRGVNFEIRELPEVTKEFGGDDGDHERGLGDAAAAGSSLGDGSSHQIFFVAPLRGDLSPGSSLPIRITFQPQSSANYSKKLELYVKDQADSERPYLTLLCLGSGVFPRLTFSKQHLELPNVPLGITSRGTVTLFNNGYNALDITHRVSPNIPVPLDVSYPDGKSVGLMVDKIRVVVACKSDSAAAWTGKIEFYDQDGERFVITVSSCIDSCLLTNYPFVRDYSSDYGFIGLEDQPVRFLPKVIIAELRLQENKRKEEQRKQRSLERMRAVEAATSGGAKGVTTATAAAKDAADAGSHASASDGKKGAAKKGKAKDPAAAIINSMMHDADGKPIHEGVDLERGEKTALSPDDREISFLLKWLNCNIARRKFDVANFPQCVVSTSGELVIDCIEMMCGKRIPSLKGIDGPSPGTAAAAAAAQNVSRLRSGSMDSVLAGSTAGDAVFEFNSRGSDKQKRVAAANKLVYKYQQLLNFLVNNGALLSHVNPVSLLGKTDHLLAQEFDLTRDKSVRFTPAMLKERHDSWEAQWLSGCKKAWLEVLYQSIKVFVLSRVNYAEYSKMPGVVITNRVELNNISTQQAAASTGPTNASASAAAGDKKKKRPPQYPRDLAPSNIFTHSEAVLLAWASYHLEHAVKLTDEGANSANAGSDKASLLISFNKRVVDVDGEFKDLIAFFQLIHSHIADATRSGEPISGYTTFDRSKVIDGTFPVLEEALLSLRMDLGVTVEEVTCSSRNLLLLLLHFFLHLPNFIPKTKIEFTGELGTPIRKQVELTNPSKKPIEYDVTLAGSENFTAEGSSVIIPPESTVDFLITLNAKFMRPELSKLTFWARRDSNNGGGGSTMCFQLASVITGRRPIDTINRGCHLFDLESFQVPLRSPYGKDAVFQLQLQTQFRPLKLDEMLHGNSAGGGKNKSQLQQQQGAALRPVQMMKMPAEHHALSALEKRAAEEEAELEFMFRQPFWCNEDSVSLSKSTNRTITVYFLPFLMGSYSCQIVLLEKDTGEFCKELRTEVGLPKVSEKLDFTAVKNKPVHLAMRVASKNLAFEKAFTAIADHRIKNANKKIKARAMFQNMIASPVLNEDTGVSNFLLEFLSSFFTYKKAMHFVSDYMLFGKQQQQQGMLFRENSSVKSAAAGAGANNNKYKKMLKSLIEAMPQEEQASGADAFNTSHVAFTAAKAGQYHSLAVVYSKDNHYDIRVLEVHATVTTPDSKMALEFEGPARQQFTQQLPIENASAKDWVLVVQVQGKGFSAPKSLTIAAGAVASLEVGFMSLTAGDFSGVLHLRNVDGSDNFEYKLHALVEDPLAEGELNFQCHARKRAVFTIPLQQLPRPAQPQRRNERRASKTAESVDQMDPEANSEVVIQRVTAECDLPYVSFPKEFQVTPDGYEFKLTVNSPMSGALLGAVTFTDAETGSSVWYTIAIDVTAPKEERSIDVTAAVRTAVAVDITLQNPTDELLVFDVRFIGDGLIGEDTFQLLPAGAPMQQQRGVSDGSDTYELIYSPLLTGSFTGQITFTNASVGLLWYKLNLTALPADPVVLEPIESMVGASSCVLAPIENPLQEPVVFSAAVEDPEHFWVVPDQLTLAPFAQSTFEVHFRPSSINEKCSTAIRLVNHKFGEVLYQVSGVGLLPGNMPVVSVDAPLGEIGSSTIVFRNPFPHPLPVDVKLSHAAASTAAAVKGRKAKAMQQQQKGPAVVADAETAFSLLSKKTTDLVVPAKSVLHIPMSFSPTKMGRYEALIEIRSVVTGRSLLWCYPVHGLAEAGVPHRLPAMKTACKTSITRELDIPLEGIRRADIGSIDELRLADFAVELNIDETVRSVVHRAFRVQPLQIIDTSSSSEQRQVQSGPQLHGFGKSKADFAVRCRMLLEPLRTFVTSVELVVKCASRGKWRARIDLEAAEPAPDDVIRMVAPVGGSDVVSFRLNNRFLGYSNFQAYFSAKSSPHFTVSPSSGVLAPFGAEGTLFTVTFAPVEYGMIEVAMLNIVTDDAQWTYEVRGSYPDTSINPATVRSKVDSWR